jgi:hypothetical protein
MSAIVAQPKLEMVRGQCHTLEMTLYDCGLLEYRRLDDGASSPLMIHVFDVADQIADDF